MVSSSITEDMTIWYPRTNGDYSAWKQQFDDKIAEHCAETNTFETGITTFGDKASVAIFDGLSTADGGERLLEVVHKRELGGYLGTKAGWIAFIVIALIFMIASCVFAGALSRKFRRCFARGCKNACIDRPRTPPNALKGAKPIATSVSTILVLIALLVLSIVSFVYTARLSYGTNSMTCDLWLSMRGHYFGTEGMSLYSDVVPDWKGSNPQHVAMRELANLVNPKPEDESKRCELCENIYKVYNGPGGLVETLSGSRDKVMAQALLGQKQMLAMQSLTYKIGNLAGLDIGIDDYLKECRVLSYRVTMDLRLGPTVGFMVATYAKDLNTTTDDGIDLFNHNLETYLGRNSTMLDSSHATAVTSLDSLSDVDYVIAKICIMWDMDIAPMLMPAIKAALAFASLMGIFALLSSVGGLVLYIVVRKSMKKETIPSKRTVSLMGVLYAVLLVLSGITFFISSILLLIGSIGKDGCLFVEEVAFDQGRWQVFPPIMWNETLTNHTDIPTVLDTCVKETGDGDVAASLGLRMLMEKLNQDVDRTGASLTATVDERLNLKVKSEKTAALAASVASVGDMIYSPVKPQFKCGDSPPRNLNAGKWNFIRASLTNETVPMLIITPYFHILGAENINIGSAVPLTKELGSGLVFPLSTIPQAIEHLQFLAAKNPQSNLKNFCLKSLEINKDASYKCTDPEGAETLMFDGAADEKGAVMHPVSREPKWNTFVSSLRETDGKMGEDYETALAIGNELDAMDHLWQFPLKQVWDAKPSSKEPSYGESLTEVGLAHKCDIDTCTFYQYLQEFNAEMQVLSQTLVDAFDLANNGIVDFVQNTTVGTFQRQLADANSNLENFNCQFVGTSLKAGLKTALCGVVMPSIASLGLSAILLWAVSGIGSFVCWKAYHYYRDIHNEDELDGVVEAGAMLKDNDMHKRDIADLN